MPRAPKFSARMLGGAFILLVLPVTIAAASEHHPARTYLHNVAAGIWRRAGGDGRPLRRG